MSRFKAGMVVQIGVVQRKLVRQVPGIEKTWMLDKAIKGFKTVSEDEMRPAKISLGRSPLLLKRERDAIKHAK